MRFLTCLQVVFLSAQVPPNFRVVFSKLQKPNFRQGRINTVRQLLQGTKRYILAPDISGFSV